MLNVFRSNKIIDEPPPAKWLFSSKEASILWLIVRLFVGEQWIAAGVSKLWGAENPSFMHNGGAGLAGFAKGAIAQSTGPYAQVHYNWWVHFLHGFVIPNASWIAKCVAISEFAIGIAIVLGLFTGLSAFAGV